MTLGSAGPVDAHGAGVTPPAMTRRRRPSLSLVIGALLVGAVVPDRCMVDGDYR